MSTPRRTTVNIEELLGSMDDVPAVTRNRNTDVRASTSSSSIQSSNVRGSSAADNAYISSSEQSEPSFHFSARAVSSNGIADPRRSVSSPRSLSQHQQQLQQQPQPQPQQPQQQPPAQTSIHLSQIQEALRGVSASNGGAQLYHGPNSNSREHQPHHHASRPALASPTNTAMANNLKRNQEAAAAIPMTAYEALAKLASEPQRRHYQGDVSLAPSQRYPSSSSGGGDNDAESVLSNSSISVFDVARGSARDPIRASSSSNNPSNSNVRVSDLLKSRLNQDHYIDSSGWKRFEYTQSSTEAPYANVAKPASSPRASASSSKGSSSGSSRPRASSAPPARTLSASLQRTKSNTSNNNDDNSTVASGGSKSSLSQASLYNALYNPRAASTGRTRPSVSSSNNNTNNNSNDKEFKPVAKGFRTCSVPHAGPNAGRVDTSIAAQAETEIISQLRGTAGGLRKTLQRADVSRSGKLNFDDFRMSLKKAGINITDDKASALFYSHSEGVGGRGHGYYGYTGGKALDIENFVLRIASKSAAPLYAHVANNNNTNDSSSVSSTSNKSQAIKAAEEMRILRKVVHATNKQADPMQVFRTLEPRQKRYLTPQQFRDGLSHIGAPLNDVEFEVLMNKVDANHDGRIDVGEFQTMLHMNVGAADTAAIKSRQQLLHSHERYTPTYKSNALTISEGVSEFGHVCDSAVVRREDYRWSKLKSHLQVNKDAVLKAFSPSKRGGSGFGSGKGSASSVGYVTQPLTVQQLRANLAAEGVYLCEDDAERLQVHVERAVGADQQAMSKFGAADKSSASSASSASSNNDNTNLTLDTFCNIVGIQRAASASDNRTMLVDPRQSQMDGGVFASSSKSLMGNPTFGTSYFISGEEDGPYVKGNRRRKVPQAEYEHHTAAHKFWQLDQAAGGPELTVSPMPSLREPYIVPTAIGTNRPISMNSYYNALNGVNGFTNNNSNNFNRVLMANNNDNQVRGRQQLQQQQSAGVGGRRDSSSINSIGSETGSYMLQTPFATTTSNNNSVSTMGASYTYRPTKQRAQSAPPRSGSAVASLLQHHPATAHTPASAASSGRSRQLSAAASSSSRHLHNSNSNDAHSVSTAETTRSNMSSSRNTTSINNNNASRVSMSMADFISPPPSLGGTPFDTYKTTNGSSSAQAASAAAGSGPVKTYNLKRAINEPRPTGAVAESIFGYR